jgi:hypothetical protein
MSWLVESLLRNRYSIKENPDMESDSYNNILAIEAAIRILSEDKFITSLEVQVLELVSAGYTFVDLEKVLGLSRETISKIFIGACNKISYYLGGEFTDEGMLEYMEEKYHLEENQINHLREFMKSKFKHKLVRKEQNDRK